MLMRLRSGFSRIGSILLLLFSCAVLLLALLFFSEDRIDVAEGAIDRRTAAKTLPVGMSLTIEVEELSPNGPPMRFEYVAECVQDGTVAWKRILCRSTFQIDVEYVWKSSDYCHVAVAFKEKDVIAFESPPEIEFACAEEPYLFRYAPFGEQRPGGYVYRYRDLLAQITLATASGRILGFRPETLNGWLQGDRGKEWGYAWASIRPDRQQVQMRMRAALGLTKMPLDSTTGFLARRGPDGMGVWYVSIRDETGRMPGINQIVVNPDGSTWVAGDFEQSLHVNGKKVAEIAEEKAAERREELVVNRNIFLLEISPQGVMTKTTMLDTVKKYADLSESWYTVEALSGQRLLVMTNFIDFVGMRTCSGSPIATGEFLEPVSYSGIVFDSDLCPVWGGDLIAGPIHLDQVYVACDGIVLADAEKHNVEHEDKELFLEFNKLPPDE